MYRVQVSIMVRFKVTLTLTPTLTLPLSKSGATIWHLFFVHPATYYDLRYDELFISSLVNPPFCSTYFCYCAGGSCLSHLRPTVCGVEFNGGDITVSIVNTYSLVTRCIRGVFIHHPL